MLKQGLTTLPRDVVRRILVISDTFLIITAVVVAFGLQGDLATLLAPSFAALFFLEMTVLGSGLVMLLGLHRIKLAMFNAKDVSRIAIAAICLCLIFVACAAPQGATGLFAKTLIFGGALFCGSVGMRAVTAAILSYVRDSASNRQTVAIFGAGGAGIQLASALRQSRVMRPVLFFDDNPHLHGMAIGGIPVSSTQRMKASLAHHKVKMVLVALPENATERRAAVIEQLERIGVDVRIVPPFVDMLLGRGDKALLRTVGADEILGRDAVDLETLEISETYAGRVVMVTGAGGSIGSELCRQILNCRPAKLVLFEQSEFNLYKLESELRTITAQRNVEFSACLGSVTDAVRVRQVLTQENVEIVFHAAAYKHVPIVEENEIEGANNNVIGTKVVAEAAIETNVKRFILVSTDKAVRPTNIMGATKRMAELVVQDLQAREPGIKFSMVRFGNVLGSSGSVLPLFQRQIEAGGPVTVTHQEVCRFFMTISESARLVLLAGAYAVGGDVFVLDMGRPQKIMNIAQRMIELSGRTVKKPGADAGDIEIIVTGLRPGEKLYEELLIDRNNLCATSNPKILRAKEAMLGSPEVAGMLRELNVAIKTANASHLRKVVRERVDGYHEPKRQPEQQYQEHES